MAIFQEPDRAKITRYDSENDGTPESEQKKARHAEIHMPCFMESLKTDYLPASSKLTLASSLAFTVTF